MMTKKYHEVLISLNISYIKNEDSYRISHYLRSDFFRFFRKFVQQVFLMSIIFKLFTVNGGKLSNYLW